MSSHFSANQYESAFASQRLQNYQVSAKHKERPSLRKGATDIIVNDRGHLNPDISRSTSSPWGSFVGTWQMQRKPIQLQTRCRLTAHLYGPTPPGSVHSCRTPSARAGAISKESHTASPRDGSRPNSSDSNSSWVIIGNDAPRVVVDSRPTSRASNIQPGAAGSRTPTPSIPPHSPSVRSPSAISSIAEVSIPPSPAGSHKMASRPQSQTSHVSGDQSPPKLNTSVVSPTNVLQSSGTTPH